MPADSQLNLITAIVQQKDEKRVLDALQKAGAPGVTYFFGRGTGVREKLGLIGLLVESEKVIFLIAAPATRSAEIVESVKRAAQLDTPGNGFLFVQKVEQAIGLA
jgi:nitrogen regulatory protein P-II 1